MIRIFVTEEDRGIGHSSSWIRIFKYICHTLVQMQYFLAVFFGFLPDLFWISFWAYFRFRNVECKCSIVVAPPPRLPSHNLPIYGCLEARPEWGLENREIYEIGQLLFHPSPLPCQNTNCNRILAILDSIYGSSVFFWSFKEKLEFSAAHWEPQSSAHFGEVWQKSRFFMGSP